MSNIVVRQLTVGDLGDVKRLHKYATCNGKPVFGQYDDDAAEVLDAAAARTQGAFGLVALLTDPDEPDEPDLVGTITGQIISTLEQHNTSDSRISSSRTDDDDSPASLAAAAAAASTPPAIEQQGCDAGSRRAGADLVLLTLVVRADARKQGVGQQLLQAFIAHAQDHKAGQPLQRVVTDIALSNQPAWQFFERSGFKKSMTASDGSIAEAVLLLMPQGSAAAAAAGEAHSGIQSAACKATAAVLQGSVLSRDTHRLTGTPSSRLRSGCRHRSVTAVHCTVSGCYCESAPLWRQPNLQIPAAVVRGTSFSSRSLQGPRRQARKRHQQVATSRRPGPIAMCIRPF